MGAQHSSLHKGGGVRLRRRAPTMGITTSTEMQGDLVDIAHAVKLVEAQRNAAKAAGHPISGSASPAAAVSPGPGSPLHPAAPAPGNRGNTSGRRLHPSAAALQMELPPWEVVANLGESEWIAFRAWMEAGWRCRKCGHTRDDHGDHPRALRLLCQCGVPIPNFKGPTAANGAPLPFSPSPRNSTAQPSVGYASESPDNQVGYLSDQSSRSRDSSRGASPLHHACPLRPGRPESPRFANEGNLAGTQLHFPERLSEAPEQANRGPERLQTGVPARTMSGNFGGADTAAMAAAAMAAGCPHFVGAGAAGAPGGASIAEAGDTIPPGALPQLQMLKQAEMELRIKDKILRAVARANQIYFIDKEPNGTLVFDFLLSALLDITNSTFGWISSALLKADGTPYLKTHAMSNVCWNKELKAWYAANAHKGLVFTNLNSLHGSIVYSGQAVITNNAQADPRSRGVPAGHPTIEKFFGVPLFTGSELIGIYGVANSPDGYSEALQRLLEPLTLTISQMMYAVNERKRRKEAELQLSSVVQIAKEGILSMSYSGQITTINMAAREMFGLLPGGGGQGKPPAASVGEDTAPPNDLQFMELVPEIDGKTNYLRKGLEPQAGHVHRGIGRRTDGSTFPLEVSIAKGSYGTVFYMAVVRDITDELRTKAALAACTCQGKGEVPAEAETAPALDATG